MTKLNWLIAVLLLKVLVCVQDFGVQNQTHICYVFKNDHILRLCQSNAPMQ